mmetsp:Transcript_26069/g.66306  ORF Transcript_26069/g.66306 Transcript_26069/m.66306 type:complete len:354 (+) Transcript_26069:1104-2165(+)
MCWPQQPQPPTSQEPGRASHPAQQGFTKSSPTAHVVLSMGAAKWRHKYTRRDAAGLAAHAPALAHTLAAGNTGADAVACASQHSPARCSHTHARDACTCALLLPKSTRGQARHSMTPPGLSTAAAEHTLAGETPPASDHPQPSVASWHPHGTHARPPRMLAHARGPRAAHGMHSPHLPAMPGGCTAHKNEIAYNTSLLPRTSPALEQPLPCAALGPLHTGAGAQAAGGRPRDRRSHPPRPSKRTRQCPSRTLHPTYSVTVLRELHATASQPAAGQRGAPSLKSGSSWCACPRPHGVLRGGLLLRWHCRGRKSCFNHTPSHRIDHLPPCGNAPGMAAAAGHAGTCAARQPASHT